MEISDPEVEEVKDILRRWKPFHREASSADRLDNLYPHIYQVPVVARGMGLREDYFGDAPCFYPERGFSADHRQWDTGLEPQLRSVDRAGKIGSSARWF